jgi:hypothetical protein
MHITLWASVISVTHQGDAFGELVHILHKLRDSALSERLRIAMLNTKTPVALGEPDGRSGKP